MKYVVFKSEDGCFRGFTSKINFDNNDQRNLLYFPEEGETYEEFDGPECDGTDEVFGMVLDIAKKLCKEDE